MKRRNFLKYTAPLTATPLMLAGAPGMRPFATHKMLSALVDNCAEVSQRALVLIQLKGGNDGLNTVIPIAQYDDYAGLRPTIKIDETALIDLDTTLAAADQVGLNPAMTAIKQMYDDDMVNIIQGVSYDNQNRSHFKSRDLYWTGSDGLPGNDGFDTGWMGRYLDAAFPGAAGNPSGGMQDPLGIQLGDSKPSFGFASENANEVAVNLYGQDPGGYYSLINSVGGEPISSLPAGEYGAELNYIMGIENSVEVYAQRITNVFNAGANSQTIYPDTNLADQLKTVARMLDGGSQTKIFLASIDGFDTHNNQVVSGSTSAGTHAALWDTISQAVKAFTDDLGNLGLEEKVMTVTFSEFGRKAVENGNYGTDHGTLSNMFVFGSSVTSGVTGTNVDLSNLYQGTQLQGMQHDYRQVFTTLLQDWLGASDALVSTAFPTGSFSKINLVNSASIADPTCYGGIALPIELSNFSARLINDEQVEIDWQTALEIDADYFEVQRSANGADFTTIDRLAALGRPGSYETYDEEPLSGVSYYRLKQVETNGQHHFSRVEKIEIERKAIKSLRLSPNPTHLNSFANITATENTTATLKVISLQGMIHRNETVAITEGFNKFELNVNRLSAGMYVVMVEDKRGRVIGQERLLVQR